MLASFVAAIVMLHLFDPATSGAFPPCPLRYLTGWYCPGCGSLRAFHQLLHGHLGAAWAMNPLTILLLPFLAYEMAALLPLGVSGRRLPRLFLPPACIRALGVVIILFGIARNIPAYPFHLLAPGAMLHP
jgi:hypothetical protein